MTEREEYSKKQSETVTAQTRQDRLAELRDRKLRRQVEVLEATVQGLWDILGRTEEGTSDSSVS